MGVVGCFGESGREVASLYNDLVAPGGVVSRSCPQSPPGHPHKREGEASGIIGPELSLFVLVAVDELQHGLIEQRWVLQEGEMAGIG